MLTFVLLYIIIITSLGVITPTYVNIYMYIFLHMYSVYQNIYLVDFVESDALIQERNGLSSSTLRLWWYDESPHKFAHFFLFGVLTMFSLFTLVVSPLYCVSGEYPEKRHFFKMVVWKGQPYASAKETHASVSFLRGLCWLLIFFVV